MNIWCAHSMSDSEDLSNFSVLSLNPPELPSDDHEVLNEDDVGYSLTEFASIQNKKNSACIVVPAPDNSVTVNAVKGVEIKDPHELEPEDKLSNDKCLSKCASFPFSARIKCSADISDVVAGHKGDLTTENLAEKGCARSANWPYPRSISLPTPLKLVSAMKGSREKQGAPPRNLTVTWAPDVYDPIPTSVSHVPNNKPQRYRNDNKRSGKNKQKGGGKSSRSKGKEKKHSRKSGAMSSIKLPMKFVDNENSNCGACSVGPQASTLDYGIGSPDPFCGHSFLMKSVTPLHFPVTEAT